MGRIAQVNGAEMEAIDNDDNPRVADRQFAGAAETVVLADQRLPRVGVEIFLTRVRVQDGEGPFAEIRSVIVDA